MAGRPRTVSDAHILQGAARVLSRLGPARMSLSDVGREVSLSPATLLQRFGSKRGLLLALSRSGANATRDAFANARERSPTPLAALHNALALLTVGIATPESLSNNLAFLQLDLTDEDFHREALAHADALVEEIWVLLEEAVSYGQLAPTDTARLAEALYVTYNGALVTWAIRREGDLAAALHEAIDLLLQPHLPAWHPNMARPASPSR